MSFATLSNILKIYSWPQIEEKYTYKSKEVNSFYKNISYSKDGSVFVLVPENGSAEILTCKNSQLKLLQKITSIHKPSWASFSTTTKKLITIGTSDGGAFIYDLKHKKLLKKFPKCNSSIYKIEYAMKDNHIVCGCTNGELVVFGNKTNVISSIVKLSKVKISTFCCHSDKPQIVCLGNENGTIKLWDIHKNISCLSLEHHVAPIKNVVSPYSKPDLILSISVSNNLCLFDINSSKLIGKLKEQYVTADICPDGKNIICGNLDGYISSYDIRNFKKPTCSLKVQETNMKHVVFQKYLKENCNNSTLQIGEDVIRETNLHEYSEASFDLDYCSLTKSQTKPIDSFLTSIEESIDETSKNDVSKTNIGHLPSIKEDSANENLKVPFVTLNSRKEIKSTNCVLTDMTNSPDLNTNTQRCTNEEKMGSNKINLANKASTPLPVSSGRTLEIMSESPITGGTNTPIPTIMNATVCSKFEQYMNNFKKELLMEVKHVTNSAKNSILLSQVTDVNKMENLYARLKEDLLSDTVKIYTNTQHINEIEVLKRENICLKQEIAALRAQLREQSK